MASSGMVKDITLNWTTVT